MTAREIMQAVRNAEADVRDLTAQRAHYMEVAQDIGRGVKSSKVRLADIDRKIVRSMEAYTKAHVRASDLIEQMQSIRGRRLLTLRYLCGMSWADIQRAMGYQDEKSAYRLHGAALAECDDFLQGAG